MPVKLLKVVKSSRATKKWDAHFSDGTKTSFGAKGFQDYTQHGDKVRREAYRQRHKDDLDTEDPTRAGYLSYYILWGDSTDLDTNVASYKRRFNM
jgi:hypothetical protein